MEDETEQQDPAALGLTQVQTHRTAGPQHRMATCKASRGQIAKLVLHREARISTCYFGKIVWDLPPSRPVKAELGEQRVWGDRSAAEQWVLVHSWCVCIFETFPNNCFLSPDWFDYKVMLFPCNNDSMTHHSSLGLQVT